MPLAKPRFRITEYSEKRKVAVRAKERRIQMVALSLTSMVDMFAILVIFLLTNSSSVAEWLEVSEKIQLPKARVTETPLKALTLQLSSTALFSGKEKILDAPDIAHGTGLGKLSDWLRAHRLGNERISLVADERIDFGSVKRVIATCQTAGLSDISLVVQPYR